MQGRRLPKKAPKSRLRAPIVTRERLLNAAFEEIHLHGYQAASLDDILARAGVTKGALYHHFPDKASLGCAVLDDVVRGLMLTRWTAVLPTENPVTGLQRVFRERSAEITSETVELGCPLNNLAQEMSPIDERFRRRINSTLDEWTDSFASALARGQAEGTVRRDIDARKVAAFLVSAVEGSYGMAKGAKSTRLFRANLEVLAGYVETLRPLDNRS